MKKFTLYGNTKPQYLHSITVYWKVSAPSIPASVGLTFNIITENQSNIINSASNIISTIATILYNRSHVSINSLLSASGGIYFDNPATIQGAIIGIHASNKNSLSIVFTCLNPNNENSNFILKEGISEKIFLSDITSNMKFNYVENVTQL